MEYTVLVLAVFCFMSVQAEEPVPSSQVSARSRYREQIEFISNYLQQAASNSTNAANKTSSNNTNDAASVRQQSPFDDKTLASSVKDNNTTPNEIQVIPVPAAVSSAIDTLPVHPRIPRRSSGRRRARNEHRHSTRVFQGQPVRFLLPPFQNEIFEILPPTTSAPISTNVIFIPPVRAVNVTSTTTEAADYDHDLSENKLDQKEPKQSSPGPQHRRVFIPPPLRYLLPPFFYENYINAQSTTLPTTVTQERTTEAFTLLTEDYFYYSTNSSVFSQNHSVESSSLAPIIVIETASQPDDDQSDWNYPAERVEYTTYAPTERTYNNPEQDMEGRSPTPFSLNKFSSGSLSQQQNSKLSFKTPFQYEDYEGDTTESYNSPNQDFLHSTVRPPFSSKSTPQSTEMLGFVYGRYKTTPNENYPSRTTTTVPSTASTSTSHTFLRGPNIEQALFETGEFQSFNTSSKPDDSGDPTLTMMNRPLLAQEVAKAGMKITANIKKKQINRENLSRGKSKFRHLNQFNFESDISSRGPQLAVAETSYYNGRRASKHFVQEADIRAIPGRAGQDYPTYTKPPKQSDFSCRSVGYHRGYVADPSTGCQVFYICVGDGPGEPMLCPNGTIFSQDFLVCDWWYNVDCQRQT